MSSLSRLLAPRSMAVIGASNDAARIGGRPLAWMIQSGFGERLYPVNPGRQTVQGLRAYASVLDIEDSIDCAVIALPADAVLAAARDCARKKVGALVIFSAGFAESGPAGVALQAELTALARETGMRILGPNCLGMFNVEVCAFPTFSSWIPQPSSGFKLGVVSQSGAYASHILRLADARGLQIGQWVSTGNEADVEVGEVIGELASRSDVHAILVYIEGIRSRDNFLRALDTARERRVPVVVVKAGATQLGAAAAASHTAALVGSDEVYDLVFRSYGVFRAQSTEEALDVAYALSIGKLPGDSRVAVMSVSGGVGVQIADYLEAEGLQAPELSAPTQAGIKLLSPQAATRNPVDITGHVVNDFNLIERSLDLIMGREGIGTVLCFLSIFGLVPAVATQVVAALEKVSAAYPDHLKVVILASTPETRAALEARGWLVFEEPRRAVRALAALVALGRAFAAPREALKVQTGLPRILPGQRFNEVQAKELVRACGIATPPECHVDSAPRALAAAETMGYPVALKIVSQDIAHKTEAGGVMLNIAGPEPLMNAMARMTAAARAYAPDARLEGFIVSKMVSGGVECVLGVKRDSVFGPVIVFGLGGVLVELLGDVSVRLAPISEAQALEMMGETIAKRLLEGYRGSEPCDIAALAAAMAAMSRFAADNADAIEAMEINPLRVMPAGQGVLALDAVVQTIAATSVQ